MVSLSHDARSEPPRGKARERIALGDFIRLQLVFWGAFLTIRIVAAWLYYPQVVLSYMGPRFLVVAVYAGATTLMHLAALRLGNRPPRVRLAVVLAMCAALLYPLHLFEDAVARLYAPSWPQERFIDYFMTFGWIFAAW